jgi:hypothetical protein
VYALINQPGYLNHHGIAYLPDSLPCTVDAIEVEGIYLIDEGIRLLIFVGGNANKDLLLEVRKN